MEKEMDKYEEYLKKLSTVESKEAEAINEKNALNEEYKEVIEKHKVELEEAFKNEQKTIGESLVGKYFMHERKFKEDNTVKLVILFHLTGYSSYSGERGQGTPIIYIMSGMETVASYRGDDIMLLNSRRCNGKDERDVMGFAIANNEYDRTLEISEKEYERRLKEMTNAYYGE